MTMFKNKVVGAMTVLALGVFAAGCVTGAESDEEPGLDEAYTVPVGLTLRVLNRGLLDGDASIETKWRGETDLYEAEDGAELDFVMVEITLAAGGSTGWHSHPGPVFATFAQGTVTIYPASSPCVGEDFSAGQALIEQTGDVDNVKNHGTTSAVVYGTFVVPHGSPFRIDEPAPPGSQLCP